MLSWLELYEKGVSIGISFVITQFLFFCFANNILFFHRSVMKETAMFLTAGIVISAFGELFYVKLLTIKWQLYNFAFNLLQFGLCHDLLSEYIVKLTCMFMKL